MCSVKQGALKADIMYFSSGALLKFVLLTSLFMASCSSNWLALWISLELNMMVFIPMLMSESSSMALENSLKYFLIQSVASLWFIFSCLLSAFTGLGSTPFIATLAIALKLGIAPFHGWFISIMSSASFSMMFILSTVQKFIPLLIMSIFPGSGLMVKVLVLVTLFSVFSLGLAQLSVKKIFAVSSMNNVSWMVLATQVALGAWGLYLAVYSLMLVPALAIMTLGHTQHISHSVLISLPNSVKMSLVFSLMSLGGLPPFLGFFNKLLMIKLLYSLGVLVLLSIIFSSLMLLYYYLSWSFFLLTNTPASSKEKDGAVSMVVGSVVSQSLVLIPILFNVVYLCFSVSRTSNFDFLS